MRIQLLLNLVVLVYGPNFLAAQNCDSLLSALYPFSNGTVDLSSNNYTGGLQGDATVSDYLMIPQDDESALIVPAQTIDGANDFTFSFRVRFREYNTQPTANGFSPINSIISGFAQNNAFGFGYAQPVNFFNFTLQGVAYEFSPADTLLPERWYCLAVTRRQNVANIYLDGEPVNAGFTVPVSPVNVLPNGLVLGQDQDCPSGCYEANQSLNGDLDNFRIYRRSLSSAELALNCQKEIQEITICPNDTFAGYSETGSYEINFLTEAGCDGIRVLNLRVANDSTPIEEIPILEIIENTTICPGDNYRGYTTAGNYLDTLQSEQGCDTILRLNLSVSSVYVPNAFSPNADGVNDRFRVFTNDENLSIVNFRIFNKWGGLVHLREHISSVSLAASDQWWDGRNKGAELDPGTYVYSFEVVCQGGNQPHVGSFTLLR